MNPSELLTNLTEQGVKFVLNGNKLSIRSPKGIVTPAIHNKLTNYKLEILKLLGEQDSPNNHSDNHSDLSLSTIGRLLSGSNTVATKSWRSPVIDSGKMAQKLTVTFRPLPKGYNQEAVLQFRQELQLKLQEYGVKVEPWSEVSKEFCYPIKIPLLGKIDIKTKVVKAKVNAVIDVERPSSFRRIAENFVAEKLYQFYRGVIGRGQKMSIPRIAKLISWAEEHTAKYLENPTDTQVITLTEIDQEFINPQLQYRQKIGLGLNTLIRNFSEIVVGVSSDRISILNMNLADSLFSRDKMDRFVLKSLIPKIFVPIAPLLMNQFELGEYNPCQSSYASKLVQLGQQLATTGLFPPGFKLSQVIKRQSHRDIVDIIVNGRTGVSYGFIAYAEPPQYIGEPEISPTVWEKLSPVEGLSFKEIRQNDLGRRYLKIKQENKYLYKQIPDLWLVSSRSGSNKTNLQLDVDVLRIGLSDRLILQLPQGIEPKELDIKPSYDIYVMVAIALASALYAPKLIQAGMPIVHFHGYPHVQWFQANEYYTGVENPSVPCGTYESGVFNFLGIRNLANQHGRNINLAALIEPDHGTNIIASDLKYLIARLKKACQRGNIELGGKHFASLDSSNTNLEGV